MAAPVYDSPNIWIPIRFAGTRIKSNPPYTRKLSKVSFADVSGLLTANICEECTLFSMLNSVAMAR